MGMDIGGTAGRSSSSLCSCFTMTKGSEERRKKGEETKRLKRENHIVSSACQPDTAKRERNVFFQFIKCFITMTDTYIFALDILKQNSCIKVNSLICTLDFKNVFEFMIKKREENILKAVEIVCEMYGLLNRSNYR